MEKFIVKIDIGDFGRGCDSHSDPRFFQSLKGFNNTGYKIDPLLMLPANVPISLFFFVSD